MYKVLSVLRVGNKYCVSLEGNSFLLKNGLELVDENQNIFIIESIGMVHYKNIEDYKRFSMLILKGDIEKIGQILNIVVER